MQPGVHLRTPDLKQASEMRAVWLITNIFSTPSSNIMNAYCDLRLRMEKLTHVSNFHLFELLNKLINMLLQMLHFIVKL